MTVQERLAEVRGRIDAAARTAGRDPAAVRLVAVSKRQPDAAVAEVLAAGQLDIGENYVQEMLRRQADFPEARVHLIGSLQSNKAKKAATAALVHGLDSERVARGLAAGVEPGRRLGVLVQVNLAAEPQKAGVQPEQAEALLIAVAGFPELDPRGLTCIPPEGDGRRWFAALARLAEELRARLGSPLPELSMGMSADFEDAVLEGATLVRVGTALFGPRLP